jgi:cytoskeletal protein CcmA (bactofilin family)
VRNDGKASLLKRVLPAWFSGRDHNFAHYNKTGSAHMSKDEINAFLGSGTVYHGQLSFQGAVRIDGSFVGEIRSEGTLIIGKDAVVEGTVQVGQVVLSGRFTGEVTAGQRAILHRSAVLTGNLASPALVMEEGALLDGQVYMTTKPSATQTSPPRQTALIMAEEAEDD